MSSTQISDSQSVAFLLADAARGLRAASVSSPRLDAELLLADSMQCRRETLMIDPDAMVEGAALQRFRSLLARRIAREPMAHLLGRREFWKYEFVVSSAVLDPRPDSEILVEVALACLVGTTAPRVLDFGVGSGCLLLSVLAEIPTATGVGVDISPDALAVAADNAKRLGLGDRAEFCAGNWGAALSAEGGANNEAGHVNRQFNLIITNPPYIPADEIDALAPEVARYEPRQALVGGDDGFAEYCALIPQIPALLLPGGAVVIEAGAGQADGIEALLRDAGLGNIRRFQDLGGIDRCLLARK